MGCMPIIFCTLFIFGVLLTWLNLGYFGINRDDYNPLPWLGLTRGESTDAMAYEDDGSLENESYAYTVTLSDPILVAQEAAKNEKDENDLSPNEDEKRTEVARYGQELSRSYGTATLNQPVLFIFKKTSGAESRRVMPAGTVVEVAQEERARVEIRLMGRTGWLSKDAVE